MPHDTAPTIDDHTSLVNARALTTLATAVSLVYALHQPVRWAMHVAASVDALTSRVVALEGEVAREQARRDTVEAELVAAVRDRSSTAVSHRRQ